MTALPAERPQRRLGLLIDLDLCVGCHACAVACKEGNDGGAAGPLTEIEPYGRAPRGPWLCRVFTYEAGDVANGRTIYLPKSCLHCEDAQCVTVCPTGASYKRAEDGIVLIEASRCIGCKLCAWACPYGAREYDEAEGVMKKCTLCVDRIFDERLDEAQRIPFCVQTCPAHARHFGDFADPESFVSRLAAERGAIAPLAELGYRPTCLYLPPRPKRDHAAPALAAEAGTVEDWLERFHLR